MNIRKAETRDIPRLGDLLLQVCRVHHRGRPDLFRAGGRKYTDEELRALLGEDKRPVFVAVDEKEQVMGYAFCIFQQHIGDTVERLPDVPGTAQAQAFLSGHGNHLRFIALEICGPGGGVHPHPLSHKGLQGI